MKGEKCFMVKRSLFPFVITFLLITLFSNVVCANTSWQWLTDARPLYILPFAIIGTLTIETAIISVMTKARTVKRILFFFMIVCLANLVSFLLPYIFRFIPVAEGSKAVMTPQNSFQYMTEHFPAYIVGVGFLFLTIVSEVPIVYFSLRRKADKKVRLFISILTANIITTGLVAIIERIVSPGRW